MKTAINRCLLSSYICTVHMYNYNIIITTYVATLQLIFIKNNYMLHTRTHARTHTHTQLYNLCSYINVSKLGHVKHSVVVQSTIGYGSRGPRGSQNLLNLKFSQIKSIYIISLPSWTLNFQHLLLSEQFHQIMHCDSTQIIKREDQ